MRTGGADDPAVAKTVPARSASGTAGGSPSQLTPSTADMQELEELWQRRTAPDRVQRRIIRSVRAMC